MTALDRTDLDTILRTREMTGKALAHAVGLTESQVSNYRNGLRPTPERAGQMSDVLRLTAEEIDALGWSVPEVADA